MDSPEKGRDDTFDFRLDRREFLLSSIVIGTALARPAAAAAKAAEALEPEAPRPVSHVTVKLRVNGKEQELSVDTRTTLLDLLRERLQLTGAKKGCDHGQCGACTVLVDGRRVNACLTLAAQNAGKSVTTIEGLGGNEELHPMQEAFLETDAFQCGFCTPGQILSAVALIDESKAGTEAEIREGMSGNLCRCGAYRNIISAIQKVQKARQS